MVDILLSSFHDLLVFRRCDIHIITDFSASGLSYIQIIELHLHSQNV